MPTTYQYLPDEGVILVEPFGELTLEEMVQYFQEIEDDDSIPNGTPEIVDLSKIDYFNLSHEDVFTIPGAYAPTRDKRKIPGTVTFGAAPINHGLAELIKVYFRKKMPEHFFGNADTRKHAMTLLREQGIL